LDNKQLLKISKYAYNEAFYYSQLSMAGSNQARIMEKLEDDSNYIKTMSGFIKGIVVMYLLISVVFPIAAFMEVKTAYEAGVETSWLIFISSLIFGLYFIMQMVMLLVFEMFLSSGILSGDAFIWLNTLPLEKEEQRKVIFFAFLRGLNWPIGTMLLVFPVATVIITQNMLIGLIALGISFLNLLISLSILTILGEKLNRIFKESQTNSKKSSILRIVVMVAYIVLMLVAVLSLQLAPIFLEELFYSDPGFLWYETANILLSLIPFPLNGAMITVEIYLGQFIEIPTNLIITTLVGTALFVLMTRKLISKTIQRLDHVIYLNSDGQDNSTEDQEEKIVSVEILSPVDAFYKKDKQAASRDMQMIIWFIIPFLYGVLGTVMSTSYGEMNPFTNQFYMIVAAAGLTVAVLKTDSDGGTILSALPFNIRDQVKAKLKFFIILPMGVLFPLVIIVGHPLFLPILAHSLIWVGLGPCIAMMNFLIKVRLFGKMKCGYSLDEIHRENKALKWTIMVIIDIAVAIAMVATSALLFERYGLLIYAVVYIPAEIGIGIGLYLIANKMFPKATDNE
jgi:ABC-2 type transport system permease protein